MASFVMSFAALCILALSMEPTSAQLVSTFCPTPGLYYNPVDCASYYECVAGRSVPFLRRCERGTLYNHITRQCDWPRNVDCNRTIQPVVLTNPLPATIIRPTTPLNTVSVSISNPFGRLNINSDACNNIATALYNTLRSQVARFDGGCGQNCLDALPNFQVICNQ